MKKLENYAKKLVRQLLNSNFQGQYTIDLCFAYAN